VATCVSGCGVCTECRARISPQFLNPNYSKTLYFTWNSWPTQTTSPVMFSEEWQSIRLSKARCSYLPHLDPVSTGQAAWRVSMSPSPLGCRLYQNAAAPFSGFSATFICGNTVAPPWDTSLICEWHQSWTKPQDNSSILNTVTTVQSISTTTGSLFYPTQILGLFLPLFQFAVSLGPCFLVQCS
jgi:hypothetical protein